MVYGEAIYAWETDVQKNQPRAFLLQCFESFFAAVGLDDRIPFFLQYESFQTKSPYVVFDN